MSFEHFAIYDCVYTCKLHLGRVLSVGGSKLESLGKRVLKFEVFFLNCWAFAQASSERTSSERAQALLDTVRLSELRAKLWANWKVAFVKSSLERAPSEHALKVLRLGRLSEPCPVQPHLNFRFVYFWTNPNFLNDFLDLFNHYLCI